MESNHKKSTPKLHMQQTSSESVSRHNMCNSHDTDLAGCSSSHCKGVTNASGDVHESHMNSTTPNHTKNVQIDTKNGIKVTKNLRADSHLKNNNSIHTKYKEGLDRKEANSDNEDERELKQVLNGTMHSTDNSSRNSSTLKSNSNPTNRLVETPTKKSSVSTTENASENTNGDSSYSNDADTTYCKNSTSKKKKSLKKKSFTFFSKSSKLKDFLMNTGKQKHDVENAACSRKVDEANGRAVSSVSNVSSCDDKFKSLFRINKSKLSKLHLSNKDDNNDQISNNYNNNNNNNKGNHHNINNGEVGEEDGKRSSSNSIVTPSPTTFSHAKACLVKEDGDDDDDLDEDGGSGGGANRPVSFDIKTRDLPEIPSDGLVGNSSHANQQRSLEIMPVPQQQHNNSSSSSSSLSPWQPNRLQNAENEGQPEADSGDLFIESFNDLKNKGWYWGPLSWREAEQQLKDKPIGSFLVRDSSDERYILSLSFKSDDQTHHTRIEHYRGQFSFNAQPRSHGAATIVEFIEKAIENCSDGSFSYFLRPKGPGLPPTMVRLTNPVSRLMKTHSLQHLCRFVVLSQIRRDLIDSLPVPALIKAYLACNQYYIEDE